MHIKKWNYLTTPLIIMQSHTSIVALVANNAHQTNQWSTIHNAKDVRGN